MELTKRQALFLIIICLFANKVQRLPSLVSTNVGRHGWMIFLIMGVLDILFLLLALLFNKRAKNKTTYEICKGAGGDWFAKIVYILFSVYFLANSLLPYEAVHDIFANILFDHLSWEIYSLVLALTILFLASKSLRNLGRIGELFFFIIAISFIILLVLGAVTTNYLRVLPVADINITEFLDTCVHYNLWFGDFLIIYTFVGRVKEDDGKLGWPIIITFIVSTIVVSFTYIVFYGLYEHLSSNQNSLISAISQFSLLGLDIGRVDWFLVLFFQIGAVISSSTYLYLSGDCLKQVFGLKKNWIIIPILTFIIYAVDIFIFKSVQIGASIIANVSKYFALFMIICLPIILLIVQRVDNKKDKHNLLRNGMEKYTILQLVRDKDHKITNKVKIAKKKTKTPKAPDLTKEKGVKV